MIVNIFDFVLSKYTVIELLLLSLGIILLLIFRREIIPTLRKSAVEIFRGLSDGDFKVNNIKGLVNIILIIVLILEFFHYYTVTNWKLNETLIGTVLLYVIGNGAVDSTKEFKMKQLEKKNEESY